ncbi:MAG TPA: hypothetical protein VK604_12150, partial [Bryobacteraceae bacterium]|nr:hypothetical protein [Bryobacteraceae bacterium]
MAKAGQRAKHDEAKLAAKTGPILDLSELLVRYPPGGTQNAYGNIVIVNWTLHDVRIRFSELMYAADPHAPRSS